MKAEEYRAQMRNMKESQMNFNWRIYYLMQKVEEARTDSDVSIIDWQMMCSDANWMCKEIAREALK